jgi:hypothetical protein
MRSSRCMRPGRRLGDRESESARSLLRADVGGHEAPRRSARAADSMAGALRVGATAGYASGAVDRQTGRTATIAFVGKRSRRAVEPHDRSPSNGITPPLEVAGAP